MQKVLAILVAAVALSLGLFAMPRAQAIGASDVHIYSCQVLSGDLGADEVALGIRFENTGTEELRSIVFRGAYGRGWIEFTDDGTFAPGIRIDNGMTVKTGLHGLLGGPRVAIQPYMGLPEPGQCSVVRVTSASGHVWRNPSAPTAVMSVPTIAPETGVTIPSALGEDGDPVGILSCKLYVSGRSSTLQIRYRNLAMRPLSRIVVRAAYGSGGLDFANEGTFAPGVLVSTHLGRPTPRGADEFTSMDDARDCIAVNALYADGATWQNVAVGQTEPPARTPDPSNVNFMRFQLRQVHGLPTPEPSPTP